MRTDEKEEADEVFKVIRSTSYYTYYTECFLLSCFYSDVADLLKMPKKVLQYMLHHFDRGGGDREKDSPVKNQLIIGKGPPGGKRRRAERERGGGGDSLLRLDADGD